MTDATFGKIEELGVKYGRFVPPEMLREFLWDLTSVAHIAATECTDYLLKEIDQVDA